MKNCSPAPIPDNVTEIILESISDGVFTVDHQRHIMSFNRAAEEITGIPRQKAIGRHCWEVFRSNKCEDDCVLKRTMQEGTALTNTSTYIVNSAKQRIPIAVSMAPLMSRDGKVLGGVETFHDCSLVEALRRRLDGRFEIDDIVSRSAAMHSRRSCCVCWRNRPLLPLARIKSQIRRAGHRRHQQEFIRPGRCG